MEFQFFCLILVVFIFSQQILSASGCHGGEIGRRKRAPKEEVRTFMAQCLAGLSSRPLQFNGPVDFVVIHSVWFEATSQICAASLSMDTPQCWLENSNNLISANSDLINQTKQCIIDYNLAMTGESYAGSRFPSERTEDPDDDVECPDVQELDFMTQFATEFSTETLEDPTDRTLDDFDSVINVMRQDIICPTCTCSDLSGNVGTLEEYDFDGVSGGLDCDRCWPTRLTSITRGPSRLARPLGLSAIMTGGLRMIDTCPGDPLAPDDAIVETELDLRVDCFPDSVNIRVHRCALVNLGLDLLNEFVLASSTANQTELETVPFECEPELYTIPGSEDIVYSIQGDLSTCGAVITENDTHIEYTYNLRTARDNALTESLIDFTGDVGIQFSCVYPSNYQVFSDPALIPMITVTEIIADDGVGIFDVRLSIFPESTFNAPFQLSGSGNFPIVLVPDSIYVSVDLLGDLDNLLLLVPSCVVSNSYPVNPEAVIAIIDGQCPIPPIATLLPSTAVTSNQYRFDFLSFRWVADIEQLLYIVCQVRLCEISEGCEREMCSKKKRSVTLQSDKDVQEIVIGPIVLEVKDECETDNGGCSHGCFLTEEGVKTCDCPDGFNLKSDARNCEEIVEETKKNESIQQGANHVTAASAITISLLIFIIMMLLLERRWESNKRPSQTLQTQQPA